MFLEFGWLTWDDPLVWLLLVGSIRQQCFRHAFSVCWISGWRCTQGESSITFHVSLYKDLAHLFHCILYYYCIVFIILQLLHVVFLLFYLCCIILFCLLLYVYCFVLHHILFLLYCAVLYYIMCEFKYRINGNVWVQC